MTRPILPVLAALAALCGCAPQAPALKVAPLVEQAIRAYRISDREALEQLLLRLEALKPAGLPEGEINSCSANGYLLRTIERARLDIAHQDRSTVLSMNEVARFVYFEDQALGQARLLDGAVTNWPTDYQCEKEPGNREVRYQDDAEQQAARGYFQKMSKAWKAELEEEKGPNSLKLELERASRLLASNHLRGWDRYGR